MLLWNHRITKGVWILIFLSGIVETNADLLWSSTGGGWRAMFADIGYANAFQQAGLFNESSTAFDSIATTSGASWFSTQLFYSQVFYDRTVLAETPEEMEAFVLDWWGSYLGVSMDVDEVSEAKCSRLTDLGMEDYVLQVCALAVQHGGSWANFIDAMLDASGVALGDPGFHERIVNPENRIEPLQDTDLLVQTAIMPNSRYLDIGEEGAGTDVFLGYDDESGDPNLFTVALSATFVVEDTTAGFWFGTDDLTPELHTYTAPSPPEYEPSDWADFYLKKPAKGGTVTIKGSKIGIYNSSTTGTLAPPFGGPKTSNTVQLASTSSAAGGYPSPAMPSVYAQYITTTLDASMAKRASPWKKVLFGAIAGFATFYLMRWLMNMKCRYGRRKGYETIPDSDSGDSENDDSSSCCCSSGCCSKPDFCVPLAFSLVVGGLVLTFYSFGTFSIPIVFGKVSDILFQTDDLDGLSVCSQWPNPCGPNDGQFSDGWFSDGPSVASNVGHYLKTQGVNADEPLKLIITNTNELSNWNGTSNMGQLRQFFENDFNKGVSPGDFLWNPGMETPYRSPQIFEEYVTVELINEKVVPIPNSNMTTATFSVTTIDNPAFGVTAGQPVEILLLNLNAIMSTTIFGESAVVENTQGVVDMTNHIAFNKDLVERVSSFVGGD